MDVRDVEAVAALASERLEAEVLAVAGQLAAGTCAFLVLVGEFDRRGLHECWECTSTAQWLGWKCGIGLHAAREQVRVGRRLLELPVVRAVFAEGRLSYSKVRAITRVATAGNEAELVELALHGTAAQVELACGRLRRWADPLADEAELAEGERAGRQRCHLSWWTDVDGTVVGSFRLSGEDAEVLRRAVDISAKGLAEAEPEGERRRETLDQRRARALAGMAAEWLASPDTGDGPAPEVVVHLDATAISHLLHPTDTARGDVPAVTPAAGGQGDVPAVTPAPAQPEKGAGLTEWPVRTSRGARWSLDAATRLLGDAGMRWVLDLPDGTQLDAAPHRRLPTAAQRRALRARDHHCRFPGCTSRHRLRAHHVHWWSHGGRTTVDNLVMLCAKHHHAVHDRHWTCTGTATDLHWHHPDGERVDPHPPALNGDLAELVTGFERHGIDITDEPGGHWAGDTIDWDCFFAALAPPPVPPGGWHLRD